MPGEWRLREVERVLRTSFPRNFSVFFFFRCFALLSKKGCDCFADFSTFVCFKNIGGAFTSRRCKSPYKRTSDEVSVSYPPLPLLEHLYHSPYSHIPDNASCQKRSVI